MKYVANLFQEILRILKRLICTIKTRTYYTTLISKKHIAVKKRHPRPNQTSSCSLALRDRWLWQKEKKGPLLAKSEGPGCEPLALCSIYSCGQGCFVRVVPNKGLPFRGRDPIKLPCAGPEVCGLYTFHVICIYVFRNFYFIAVGVGEYSIY